MSSASFNVAEEARIYLGKISADLDRTVAFWLKNSHDDKNGGFFTCLTKDGKVYDTSKFGWLQGRQIWTYTQLYRRLERFRLPAILEAAIDGGKFLMEKLKDTKSHKVCFSANAQGEPTKIQRTLFAEVFYVMAMSGLAKVTNENIYKREALEMFKLIIHWAREDDSDLGRPKLPSTGNHQNLAVPMCILSLVHELDDLDIQESKLDMDEIRSWAVDRIKMHVQRQGTRILENVTQDGQEIDGFEGRKMVPGHAIECGWFLLKEAQKMQSHELTTLAIQTFIERPYEYGWDKNEEGFLYFVDVDDLPPTNLEWDMKLWWPHSEAMIAFLMAFNTAQNASHWERFKEVTDYAYEHFVDPDQGEWFGYLNRAGKVSSSAKGGPYKGCFHVPRALLICEEILTKIVNDHEE
ncbi:hypothetical protein TCAL_06260 [Tigriopus californicus]|uniref:N-acylglucosamine 2-epimerase n=1 Tax=Tigriopus californicus TaxID=6832 RepID=A0A553N7T8_TIGCA|nr:N-acylglucosamine 2-epimerase-like isoform X1 [Tigriopus californicus]TRY61491.1 hypothetical protein TCAL_06260 [Tigriopus californicus]